MADWNVIMSVTLDDLGDHFGVGGLGELYERFFGSSSSSSSFDEFVKYLKGIEVKLDNLAADVKAVDEQLNKLTDYVESMQSIKYYTDIESAYENMIALSKVKKSMAHPRRLRVICKETATHTRIRYPA